MKRTNSRTRRQKPTPAPPVAVEALRARELCDYGQDKHGTDSHACVRVEVSLPVYCYYDAPVDVQPAVFTASVEGVGDEQEPYRAWVEVDAHFRETPVTGYRRQDMNITLPDIRHLPALVQTLSLLVDRARSIGMIPPVDSGEGAK